MEDERKLNPCRICSIVDEYSWGSDEFKLADLGYRDSLIKDGWLAGNSMSELMDTYMDRVVGENVYEYYGRQFPVQLKHIRVDGRMPLRVHPGDELSSQRYDLLGREKLWYVQEAAEGARLYLGLNRDIDAAGLLAGCEDGSIVSFLREVEPRAGEHFHITPGMIHGASGRLTIVEVSESSPLDFCVYAWGEQPDEVEFDPSLSLVDALDFIDYKASAPHHRHRHEHAEDIVGKLIGLPQFTVSKIRLTDALHIYSEEFGSFLLYSCLSGKASVQQVVDGKTERHPFGAGETLLVPAEVPDFLLVPEDSGTVLLEVVLQHREDPDPYIGPDSDDHCHYGHDHCGHDHCDHDDCDCED